jgi:hypothetical protein
MSEIEAIIFVGLLINTAESLRPISVRRRDCMTPANIMPATIQAIFTRKGTLVIKTVA